MYEFFLFYLDAVSTSQEEAQSTSDLISTQNITPTTASIIPSTKFKVISSESNKDLSTTTREQAEETIKSSSSFIYAESETPEFEQEITSSSITSKTYSTKFYENVTLSYTDKISSEGKKIETAVISVVTVICIIVLLLVAAVIVTKFQKCRRKQNIRIRCNRIFREVGMIPLTSVINERYMGSEEG